MPPVRWMVYEWPMRLGLPGAVAAYVIGLHTRSCAPLLQSTSHPQCRISCSSARAVPLHWQWTWGSVDRWAPRFDSRHRGLTACQQWTSRPSRLRTALVSSQRSRALALSSMQANATMDTSSLGVSAWIRSRPRSRTLAVSSRPSRRTIQRGHLS